MCVCTYMYVCAFAYVFVYICARVCGGLRLITGACFGYPPSYSLRQSELTKLASPSRHLALGNPLSLGVKGATVPALLFSRGCCGSSLKSAHMWKSFSHGDSPNPKFLS